MKAALRIGGHMGQKGDMSPRIPIAGVGGGQGDKRGTCPPVSRPVGGQTGTKPLGLSRAPLAVPQRKGTCLANQEKRHHAEQSTVRILHANLRGYPVGESWWRTKYPDATVALARELHAQGLGYTSIAKITGANWATIRDWIKLRRRQPPVRMVVRVQRRGTS